MTTHSVLAEQIKTLVPALEAGDLYGLAPNRSGFVCCPFHQERTPSCKLYEGDKGFACFGCQKTGSVIDLTQHLFGLGFMDACRKLIDDFSLPLSLDGPKTYRERKQAREALKKALTARQAARAADTRLYDCLSSVANLARLAAFYAPKTPSDESNPEYVKILHRQVMAELELEEAEDAWTKIKLPT